MSPRLRANLDAIAWTIGRELRANIALPAVVLAVLVIIAALERFQ